MCGISGIFDLGGARPVNPALVKAMNDAIAHRGPDGEGFFIAPGVGLGHRRLAIIDLSGGAQPMFDENERVVTVFNGEIYNFKDLRAELQTLGYEFRTSSDTEVVVQGWRAWGPACVERFKGMFALAIWDPDREIFFLARDRMGEKPLYYTILPNQNLLFGSELKALLVHPDLPRDIDPCAVEEFFALGYIADPRTIYRGVQRLPAGHSLTVERGKPPQLTCYWDIAAGPEATATLEQATDDLLARFAESVRGQLVSDVPIGAFLSGGVDSSATVATMAKCLDEPVRAFTIGFKDPRFDETEYATLVAQQYGAMQSIEVMDGSETSLVGRLPGIFDEPFGDSSALPTLNLMQLAGKHVTVALSGDAGDELFAGYRRYAFHAKEERLRALLPSGLRRLVFGLLGRIYPQLDWAPKFLRARNTFEELSLDTATGFYWNVRVTQDDIRSRLFSDRLKRNLAGYHASAVIRHHMEKAPFTDAVAIAQYVDLKTWLPSDILTKVDRTSMAHGLEVRVPMLDHDFVNWAMHLPRSLKLSGGSGKHVLKRAFGRLLPERLLNRTKQGFSVPLADWFRGELGAAFEAEIDGAKGLSALDLFDSAEIRRLIGQHRSGLRDHSRVLWLLWMFNGFVRDVHMRVPASIPILESV